MGRVTQPESNQPLTGIRRQGTVVGVSNLPATLTVQLGGDTTANIEMPYIIPAMVGDVVAVLSNLGDHWVLGPIGKCRPYGIGGSSGGTLTSSTSGSLITGWSATGTLTACGTWAGGGFTPNADGHYLMTAVAVWATNASGRRGMFPSVGGSQQTNGSTVPGASTGPTRHSAAFTIDVNAGQQCNISVFQDSGGNLGVNPVEMEMTWLRELN